MGKGKCPERILGNAVHGLVCGLLGGAIYVAGSGVMRGMKPAATVPLMKAQVPYIAVQLTVLVGIYSTFDCLFKGLRGEDGVLNRILSGAATGGLFGARQGRNAMVINAAIGATTAVICDQ